jgi:hypothetical protein
MPTSNSRSRSRSAAWSSGFSSAIWTVGLNSGNGVRGGGIGRNQIKAASLQSASIQTPDREKGLVDNDGPGE